MQTNILFGHISLIYSRMRHISSKSSRGNQNTRSIIFFLILPFLWESVEKYCRSR